ncbi:MAG TPA: hypothetical protein VLQ93_00820, partial [Myxococcaceae bacterium]|nr:hypothetical protein [Myxococcaceae bacterium]
MNSAAPVHLDSLRTELREACRLLKQQGLTVDDKAPSGEERVHARAGDVRRLMACLHVPHASVWLRGARGAGWVEAVLALSPDGGFVVALPPEALGVRGWHWERMARALAPLGVVRVYTLGAPPEVLPEGVEAQGLRQALEPRVREPLYAQALRCLRGWRQEDEARFVTTRARWSGSNEVLSVPEALDAALSRARGVLVLGDFGTGKSTHLRRKAGRMAEAFMERPEEAPAPVLLPLGGSTLELQELLAQRELGMEAEAFRLAVELGMAVPLMDGLDEARLGSRPPEQALKGLLAEFQGDGARVVVASRKTNFRGLESLRRVAGPGVALIELEYLDASEVERFVRQRTSSPDERASVLEHLRETHDLDNLSRRPVLLNLIFENQKRLSSGEMNAARLYGLVTEDWLESREVRDVDREQRKAVARGLARRLFGAGAASARYAEVVHELAGVLDSPPTSVEAAIRELGNAAFLAHDEKEGSFRFAHRSFLEYFLAVDIAERLERGK